MTRLIDADALKEWVENWFVMNRNYHPYAKSNDIPITELYDILERMDAVAPKKGKWRVVSRQADSFTAYRCSECNELVYGRTNFCPNCGADMSGEANDSL